MEDHVLWYRSMHIDLTIRRMHPSDMLIVNILYRSLSGRSKALFHPPFFQSPLRPKWLIHQVFLILSTIGPTRSLLKWIAPGTLHTLILAFVHRKLIGLAYFRRLKKEPRYVELGIGLLEEYQGKGIGSRLLSTLLATALEEGIENVYLSVNCDNERAIALYKKFGFVILKMVPKGDAWLGKSLDMFEMKLRLKDKGSWNYLIES